MSAHHTPAPWLARMKPEHVGSPDPEWEILDGDGYFVAVICAGVDGRQEANARAAACAPELLEALREATLWFEGYANEHYAKAKNAASHGEQHGREVKGKLNQDRANQLRAAIAKATGQ